MTVITIETIISHFFLHSANTVLSKADCLLCHAVLQLTNDCGEDHQKDLQFSITFHVFREESTVFLFICFFVCYCEC